MWTTKALSNGVHVTRCWWRCHTTLSQRESIAHCIHVWQNRRLWADLNTIRGERTSYECVGCRAVYGLIIRHFTMVQVRSFCAISFYSYNVCSAVCHQADTDVKSSHPRSINSTDSITNTCWELGNDGTKYREIRWHERSMKYACRIPALTYGNEKWQIFATTVAVAILVAEVMMKKSHIQVDQRHGKNESSFGWSYTKW